MKFPSFVALLVSFSASAAEIPRARPPGKLPADSRLGPLKELDGYFPWTPSPSREAWEKRADQVRMQLRIALGLWPEPTRTPLNAVVHGRIEREEYTVEKVFFESMPGFFVTGNLYRPRGATGRVPAVLCTHGHWNEARFALRTDAEMKKELESGGERFAESGRSMFQSIGVQLARMGVVAFVYDMIGYCDSQQISFELAHKFAKQRPEMNTRENWGLFSPQAEAHAQSIMGLQTWNSIRALDFLTSLPDVDPERLACTGASGGGTQTMLLAALDPRLAVECPAVMVSTAMQGGCTCENASLLRIGTGNVEIAALFAPKPLGMTAANDWTKEMETKGFPELKQHYAMVGAPENVALWAHLNFPHNYNIVAREHIYAWFNEHFRLGLAGDRLKEREYSLLQKGELTVWDDAHPAPVSGPEFERKLLRWWHKDAEAQLGKSPEESARIARSAWRAIIGRTPQTLLTDRPPTPPMVSEGWTSYSPAQLGRFKVIHHEVTNAARGESQKQVFLRGENAGDPVIVWLTERGLAGLFGDDGEVIPEVARALDAGATVIGVDLFQQTGEPAANRISKNPREAPAFTYGYNHPLFAQRVHDILWVLHHGADGARPARLVALDSTAPLAAAALALLDPGHLDAAAIHTHGFRFADLTDWRDANFHPAAAKYGDLPGLLALAAPRAIYLIGENSKVIAPAGNAAITHASPNAPVSAAIDWLISIPRR